MSKIEWKPISEAKKDGRPYLLYFEKDAIFGHRILDGSYFRSPKGTDDGWETCIGFVGEPKYFAEINYPEGDVNDR